MVLPEPPCQDMPLVSVWPLSVPADHKISVCHLPQQPCVPDGLLSEDSLLKKIQSPKKFNSFFPAQGMVPT
jgi:hypothetical protein